MNSYRQSLSKVRTGDLKLQNKDLDTGRPTSAGEYRPADNAYAQILDKLASHKFENVTPDLRENILAFYGDTNAHIAIKNDKGAWQKTLRELTGLRSAGVLPQRTATEVAAGDDLLVEGSLLTWHRPPRLVPSLSAPPKDCF